MDTSPVATLRHFNRAWSQRVGALDASFLGSGRPLGPSRLLFEIGPDGVGVRTLRRRLGLDSGYLSRLLRQLEDDGLVEVVADPADGRRRLATLTAKGRRERRKVDDRSERLARALVAPLTQTQRSRLDEALATAERLLRAATVVLEPVDALAPEAVAAVSSYFDELDRRFPGGFDPGDAIPHDAAGFAPPYGVFVLARGDDEVAACGGVQRLPDGVAEIKRMWVDPAWRGAGLGARMLGHLEAEAARLGHDVVRLDTNSTLVEAISMYEHAGYRSIERYNDNPYARRWFEKRLDGG
ncbi:MAG: PadR family transcriptional regulator [Nocardioides sp.]|nr:PadR family transcriptional regulator [Nocardioides sp.]